MSARRYTSGLMDPLGYREPSVAAFASQMSHILRRPTLWIQTDTHLVSILLTKLIDGVGYSSEGFVILIESN